jgi:clan AA aspartic protease
MNPSNPDEKKDIKLLVDSGADFSVIPASVLKQMGIKPYTERSFNLTDGSSVTRKIGDVRFEFEGAQATSPVVFGEKNDSSLLGMFTLETLGLILNPLNRTLKHISLHL